MKKEKRFIYEGKIKILAGPFSNYMEAKTARDGFAIAWTWKENYFVAPCIPSDSDDVKFFVVVIVVTQEDLL